MFSIVAGVIFPLFLVVFSGYYYGRRHQPDMTVANQLNMEIFLPALMFAGLAGGEFSVAQYYKLALGCVVVMAGGGLLAWLVARLCGYSFKTFVPPMMFKNAGNTGLPLLVLAFGQEALPAAVVLLLVENGLHFLLGTWWLNRNIRLWSLVRTPVLVAGIAGVAVSLLQIHIWPPIMESAKLLGNVSIGLALFALGVRLTASPFSAWKIGLVGAIVGPVTGIGLAYLFARAVNLNPAETGYLLLFGALPPAVLNYVFAERYQQEPDRVASIVMIGNLSSLLVLSATLALVLKMNQ